MQAIRPATHTSDLPVIGLVGAAHMGSHFFHLVLPPLFPWLKDEFAVSYTQLGLLMTVFFAVSGVCQALAGIVVDKIGAARVLITGKTLLASGAVLAAFAPSYEALLPIVVLMGVGNSVYHPADYAILSNRVAAPRMARAYSVHTIGGTLGWAIAPALVVTLANVASWRVALLTAGIAGLVLAAVLAVCRERLTFPPHSRSGIPAPAGRAVYLSRPVLGCFLYFALLGVAFFAVQGFLPLTLNQLHATPLVAATMAVTAYMIGSAAGTLAGGVVADRTGRLQTIIVTSTAAAALLIVMMAFVPLPVPLVLATGAVIGAFSGFTTPSRDLLVRRATPPGASGRVFGFVYSGLDLGGTVTPAVIGALLDADQPRAVLLLTAAAMAATILTVTSITLRPAAPRAGATGATVRP